jgi:SAM-dependent methyltransferase
MIDRSVEYEKMARVEKELWWYRVLHELTHSAIRKQFGSDTSISILDLGCGTGGLMLYLRDNGYQNVQGVDISEDAIRFCKDRQLTAKVGDMKDLTQLVEVDSIDVLVSNDTLYFVPEGLRHEYMTTAFSRLRPSGLLVFNLPAMQMFRGMHDRSVGITKRFNLSEVKSIIDNIGFKSYSIRFWPFSLSPLIYLVRLIQRIKMRGNVNLQIESDVNLPPAALNSLFYWLVTIEIQLFNSGPIGSSILLVLRKGNQELSELELV